MFFSYFHFVVKTINIACLYKRLMGEGRTARLPSNTQYGSWKYELEKDNVNQ